MTEFFLYFYPEIVILTFQINILFFCISLNEAVGRIESQFARLA